MPERPRIKQRIWECSREVLPRVSVAMATAGIPPCVLSEQPRPHTTQVYVLKTRVSSELLTIGSVELVEGAGAFAVVQSEIVGALLVQCWRFLCIVIWMDSCKATNRGRICTKHI